MRLSIIIFLLPFGYLFGQSTCMGLMPTIQLSKSVHPDWTIIGSVQNRTQQYNSDDRSLAFDYVLTDYIVFGSYKVAAGQKLNVGFTFRSANGASIYRISQHYNFISRLANLRIGHRIATDQTFQADREMVPRLRYRATAELPLNGSSVNPKEWYFKVGNEYLAIWESDALNYELRIVPQFGYQVRKGNKLEFGLDYRLGDLATDLEQDWWVRLSWYYKL